MTSAKELGDKMMGQLAENTGVIDAFSPSLAPLSPYFCMFGQQDLDSYSEVLMLIVPTSSRLLPYRLRSSARS